VFDVLENHVRSNGHDVRREDVLNEHAEWRE
jgi:hypothetical protein